MRPLRSILVLRTCKLSRGFLLGRCFDFALRHNRAFNSVLGKVLAEDWKCVLCSKSANQCCCMARIKMKHSRGFLRKPGAT